MKKSFLKMIAVGLLGTALLTAGCGSNTKAGESAQNGKVKIEYWHCNAETQGGKTVKELVNKFNAQSKDVEVVDRYNPDMYKGLMQNLQAEVAAGHSPAVVQVGWAFLDYFSNNFSYTPPQEIIDKYAPQEKNSIHLLRWRSWNRPVIFKYCQELYCG